VLYRRENCGLAFIIFDSSRKRLLGQEIGQPIGLLNRSHSCEDLRKAISLSLFSQVDS